MPALGLGPPRSWPATLAFAVGGLTVLLAYSPLADGLATRWFAKPPTLGIFRGLQESRLKLALGLVVAWLGGGFLEELLLRGLVLRGAEAWATPRLGATVGIGLAVVTAAALAWVGHLYQGPRAATIVAQLSVLFGLLFVASGRDLWAVMLCHAGYDTVAFVRFARKKSRYSQLNPPTGSA